MHFYDIDLNVNIYRGVFRAQSSIYGEASFQKSQKKIYCKCWTGF